jgi:hypothetical protein
LDHAACVASFEAVIFPEIKIVQTGQNVTQPDAAIEGTNSDKPPVNDGGRLGLASLGAEIKMEPVFDCARTFFQGQ